MKYRTVKLANGETFTVPQGIQRLDSASTHGWQVRCDGTKFFADGPLGDPRASLINAVGELIARMASTPGASPLRAHTARHKTTDLPVGLSGPIVRTRRGRSPVAELSVLLPRLGKTPRIKSIYIGSQNTYSIDRFEAAVDKGVALRQQAIETYELDVRRARRESISQLREFAQLLRAQVEAAAGHSATRRQRSAR